MGGERRNKTGVNWAGNEKYCEWRDLMTRRKGTARKQTKKRGCHSAGRKQFQKEREKGRGGGAGTVGDRSAEERAKEEKPRCGVETAETSQKKKEKRRK